MTQSIYQLNSYLNMLLDMDQEDEAVINTLEGVEFESDEKCINVVKYMKHLEDENSKISTEIERLKSFSISNSKRFELLKSHVLANMEARGINKIKDTLYPITRVKPRAMVEIFDETLIPKDYVIQKTTSSIDKKKLLTDLKALEDGKTIDGAKLGESKAGLKF